MKCYDHHYIGSKLQDNLSLGLRPVFVAIQVVQRTWRLVDPEFDLISMENRRIWDSRMCLRQTNWILLTVCFSRTNFTAFSWQLNWFIACWLRTFVFYVSALDTRHNSTFFRHLWKQRKEMIKNGCQLLLARKMDHVRELRMKLLHTIVLTIGVYLRNAFLFALKIASWLRLRARAPQLLESRLYDFIILYYMKFISLRIIGLMLSLRCPTLCECLRGIFCFFFSLSSNLSTYREITIFAKGKEAASEERKRSAVYV